MVKLVDQISTRFGNMRGEKTVQLACNWTAEPGFEVPSFGALYLSNRAELDFDSLTKVGVHL
jgi:hypothetical protein